MRIREGAMAVTVCLAAATVGAVAVLAGTAGDESTDVTASQPRASSPTSPTTSTTVSLLDGCTANVAYWVPKVLADDRTARYGDYQKMGLSGPEYESLRGLLDEIRAHDSAVPPAPELTRRAREHCSSRPLRAGWQ